MAERSAQYNELWKKLTYNTGTKIDSTKYALRLYNTLIAEKAMKLPIPEWAEKLLASGELAKAASLQIELKNYNTILKRLNGGKYIAEEKEDNFFVFNNLDQKPRNIQKDLRVIEINRQILKK